MVELIIGFNLIIFEFSIFLFVIIDNALSERSEYINDHERLEIISWAF